MMSKDLADKLKAARKKLNLSQSKAAAAWGMPVRTLINWENDNQTPRGFTLTQLNAMLDQILRGK
jgi:DNA-binding transcriptional regulator YiaG